MRWFKELTDKRLRREPVHQPRVADAALWCQMTIRNQDDKSFVTISSLGGTLLGSHGVSFVKITKAHAGRRRGRQLRR